MKLPTFSPNNTPHPNDIKVYLDTNFKEVDEIDKNCILLISYNGIYCHVAIATSKNTMIHADSRHKKVIEHSIDHYWLNRISNIYQIKQNYSTS